MPAPSSSAPNGGVSRTHDASTATKLGFATLHAVILGVCLWIAFGGLALPDPLRAQILAGCAGLYFLRHLVTLFILLKRKVTWSEALGLAGFMAVFELGFLLLGGGLLAISVGFIGVLLIIRPGFSDFDANVLFVLISVVGITLRDLLTRLISTNIASSVVSFQAFASLIVAGIVVVVFSADEITTISDLQALYFLGGIIFGVIGYYGIVNAMRIGDASIVSPFRYTRLLFSIFVGIFVFNEHPDALTLLGGAIIVCTGLYTFLREHLVKQQ